MTSTTRHDYETIARAHGWTVGADVANSGGADAIIHPDTLYNDSTFELGAWETVCRECGYIPDAIATTGTR